MTLKVFWRTDTNRGHYRTASPNADQHAIGFPSQDHHHRSFRDLIVKLLNVVQVHHYAAPGKMTRAAILPLPDPAVKTDAAAELRGFECGGSLFPGGRNGGLLLSRNHLLRGASVRVVFVWVVYLDPVPTVIRTVCSVEIATMLLNHEVHTLRSLVVSFDELLALALTKTHVVLLIQDTRLIKP